MRPLLAAPINGRRGMGGVFTRWLADLTTRDAGELTPADIPTLTSVTLDLFLHQVLTSAGGPEAGLPGRGLPALVHPQTQPLTAVAFDCAISLEFP